MFEFLRHHNFRKGNIAGAWAFATMLLGVAIFGRDPGEAERVVLGLAMFAVALGAVFAQYELEYRRERRSRRRSTTSID